jgi:hypothetical protein
MLMLRMQQLFARIARPVATFALVLAMGALASCSQDPNRAETWLDQFALEPGSQIVHVDHPPDLDAVDAIIDLPAPVSAADVERAIGFPAGYSEVPGEEQATAEVTHPSRGSVRSTQLATVVAPQEGPNRGCRAVVWGVPAESGGGELSALSLDIGCAAD